MRRLILALALASLPAAAMCQRGLADLTRPKQRDGRQVAKPLLDNRLEAPQYHRAIMARHSVYARPAFSQNNPSPEWRGVCRHSPGRSNSRPESHRAALAIPEVPADPGHPVGLGSLAAPLHRSHPTSPRTPSAPMAWTPTASFGSESEPST